MKQKSLNRIYCFEPMPTPKKSVIFVMYEARNRPISVPWFLADGMTTDQGSLSNPCLLYKISLHHYFMISPNLFPVHMSFMRKKLVFIQSSLTVSIEDGRRWMSILMSRIYTYSKAVNYYTLWTIQIVLSVEWLHWHLPYPQLLM